MIKHGNHYLTPFFRAQHYDGGKKMERDARSYKVNDLEWGVEWQPSPALELTVMYTHSDRAYVDSRTIGNRQQGSLMRVQLQLNY